MCGIAGIAALGSGAPPTTADVAAMLPALAHRGPDGSGVHVDGPIALGHTRLSIIDLATGAQPLSNEDGSVWVTFNGEIFNYVELRAELLAAGHRFRTTSDTEVIVHAYEQWGDDFVGRLNGQFAFALWDAPRRRLVLLRDRPGILPLYYTVSDGRLCFASELKALLPTFRSAPRLDAIALDQIFTGWAPAAPRTVMEGVREVPPGHRLVIDAEGRVTVAPYWRWEYPDAGHHDSRPADVLAEELLELLGDATRLRLRADVPVGAYLSGGLDSSALASLVMRERSATLRTFSIGFESAQHDEQPHQESLVRHLGVEHTRLVCDAAGIGDAFPETIRHAEMPILRTAPVPMRLLSAEVRRLGFRVVLTGEGADEVFGGYDLFKEAKVRRFWSRDPGSAWRPALLKRLYPWLGSARQGQAYLRSFYGIGLDAPDAPLFSHLTRFQSTAHCKQFLSAEFQSLMTERADEAFAALVPPAAVRWDAFHRAQQLEARTLMSGYLLSAQGDRMLMANSVEGRFPFLDHRVMEFAARLDPRLKMQVLNEKYLLKRAMRNLLPASILRRSKQPYRAPDAPAFFAGRALPWMEDLLSPERLKAFGYFDPSKVALLVAKARAGRAVAFRDNMAFVGILSTQLWHHHFVERFGDWRRPSSA